VDLLAEPAVRVFAFWYLVLAIKMLMLIFRTSAARMKTSTYASPEDYTAVGATAPPGGAGHDDGIERLRRALQNDLENVLPFFGVGLIYAMSGPSLGMARLLFAGFALSRVAHTIFYLRGNQPHRSIAFALGMLFFVWTLLLALWSVL
jgi:glutathione S-transferase